MALLALPHPSPLPCLPPRSSLTLSPSLCPMHTGPLPAPQPCRQAYSPLRATLRGRSSCHCPHSRDEKTEAQRGAFHMPTGRKYRQTSKPGPSLESCLWVFQATPPGPVQPRAVHGLCSLSVNLIHTHACPWKGPQHYQTHARTLLPCWSQDTL